MRLTEEDVLSYEKVREKLSPSPIPFPTMGDMDGLMEFHIQETAYYNEQLNLVEQHLDMTCTCGKGCDHCCHQLVVASRQEIAVLAHALKAWKPKKLEKFMVRLQSACDVLIQAGYPKNGVITSNQMYEDLMDLHPTFHLPCPLLSKKGACLVHPVRPTLCWMYRNYGDPAGCQGSCGHDNAVNFVHFSHRAGQRLRRATGTDTGETLVLSLGLADYLRKNG